VSNCLVDRGWRLGEAVLLCGLVSACAAAAAGCSSKGQGGADAGADAPADLGADTPAPTSTLFTDPAVPRCDAAASSRLRGLLDGQTVDYAIALSTNLTASSFQALEVLDGGVVRFNLVLTWSEPLAEDAAIPLTGTSMVMRDGQPFAGQPFCITAGEFGSPALTAGAAGRTLLFRITGAKRGTCDGPDVPVSLAGCDFRTNTSFPVGLPIDAAPEVGSAQACPQPSGADAGAQCNDVAIAGPWCPVEALPTADGGVVPDAGPVDMPEGGVLIDGDYELIRFRSSLTGRRRATLRLSNAGTLTEWGMMVDQDTSGSFETLRFNAPASRSGTRLNVAEETCITDNATFMATSYGYTVRGDDLLLFNIDATGRVFNIYTYRRICTRR
jgi:hypothetical protein